MTEQVLRNGERHFFVDPGFELFLLGVQGKQILNSRAFSKR